MKVKALCTIKDAAGTHNFGDIFETEEDLGNMVEVLEEAKPVEAPKEVAEAVEQPKPKTTRKRKISE